LHTVLYALVFLECIHFDCLILRWATIPKDIRSLLFAATSENTRAYVHIKVCLYKFVSLKSKRDGK